MRRGRVATPAPFAQSGAVDSRRSQVARLRQVALAALAEFPIPEGRLTFVTHGENTTFRHDGPGGRHLVRVHRPQRHGRDADTGAAIASELAWLRAIRADTELEVPEPVETRDGKPMTTVTAAGETRVVSVLRWMDGRIVEGSARPTHLYRIGVAMAALHRHADAWQPPAGFTRIRWDDEAFFGNVMIYGDVPAAECWDLLPAPLRARFERVAERMTPVMAAAEDVGLIHADLHLGNVVFFGDSVRLIDFDDCGTGPRLYELAVALWEIRDEKGYEEYRDALLSGYATGREIDTSLVDDYIAVRQLAFDLWFTGTANVNPDFAKRVDEVHAWSLGMLDLVGYGDS